MATNITEVRLLAVPLENDYKHTLYFSSKSEQETYFKGKTIKSGSEFSYQRKDNIIRYPADYDELQCCNYVMYKNSANSSKWYYAFITKMEYVNEGRTDISIETDVLQTWLFDFTIKESFVEREHVKSDNLGEHTIPEDLETGEYVCNSVYMDMNLFDYCYVLRTTISTDGAEKWATNYGGIPHAGGAYICERMSDIVSIVNTISNGGNADSIMDVYMIPKKIISITDGLMEYQGDTKPITYQLSFVNPENLNYYEPKNKKLLTYPYTYILMSNNSGSSNILQYEHFSTPETPKFNVSAVPVMGGSVKCCPYNYKGVFDNQEEGIMLGKFPVLSWSKDQYTNWLTQNSVNLNLGVASAGLQIIGGVAAMTNPATAVAGAGMLASGSLQIGNVLAQKHVASFSPVSAQGNTNGGDINTANKCNTFYFYQMCIKREFAEVIDRYFDVFGYKVNMFKIPNKNHRENYWYTKTIDINIDSSIIPANDMRKIKDCYNNGITFWKNASNIQNYSVSNTIV